MQSITYIRWDGPDVLVSRELSDIALTPVSGYSGRPVLGDHSVEIFSTLLGFDEAWIAALGQAGAI